MTTIETGLLTADDLLRQGVRGELIRGVRCETMPAGYEHGRVVVNLAAEIRHFVKSRQLGTVVASDTGVWLERDPDTVREPDIAFTTAEKLPLGSMVSGYSEVIPDLVVEVVSPGDSRSEVHDKAQMWLSHGVRLVWVVRPETRVVDVYAGDGAVSTLGGGDDLNGGDVLPGFSCALSDIFDA